MSTPRIMEVDHPDYCITVNCKSLGEKLEKPKLSAMATALVEVGNDKIWDRETLAAMSSEDRARIIKTLTDLNADVNTPAMELAKMNSELDKQMEDDKKMLAEEGVKKQLREMEVLGGLMGHTDRFMEAGGMLAGVKIGRVKGFTYEYLNQQFMQRGIDYENMVKKRFEDRGEEYVIDKSNPFLFAMNESRMREAKGEKVHDDILNGAAAMTDEAIKRLVGSNEDGLKHTMSAMLLKHKDKLN